MTAAEWDAHIAAAPNFAAAQARMEEALTAGVDFGALSAPSERRERGAMSDDRKKAAQGTRKVDPRWTPHVIADLGEIADICREGGRDDLADELLRRLQAELPIPRSVPRADALGRDEGRG